MAIHGACSVTVENVNAFPLRKCVEGPFSCHKRRGLNKTNCPQFSLALVSIMDKRRQESAGGETKWTAQMEGSRALDW